MWRPNEPVEEGVSDFPDIDRQSKRRRSRRGWRDGLATQTVVRNLEDVRVYRAFERALIGSVDPRSALELARWQACCGGFVVPARSKPAYLRSRANFCLDPSCGPSQPGTLSTPTRANGHSKGPGSNGRDEPPASDQEPLSTTAVRRPFRS